MKILTMSVAAAAAMAASGCAEVYHGYMGYSDTFQNDTPVAVEGGEVTTRVRFGNNQYSGNTIATQLYYGVRNTSSQDRCFIVVFHPVNVSTYGVPARTAVFAPRGRSVALGGEYWGQKQGDRWIWAMPEPTSTSRPSTAADCR